MVYPFILFFEKYLLRSKEYKIKHHTNINASPGARQYLQNSNLDKRHSKEKKKKKKRGAGRKFYPFLIENAFYIIMVILLNLFSK